MADTPNKDQTDENALAAEWGVALQAEGGGLPELKRVIVAAGEKIAMMPSLRESLAVIFGEETPESVIEEPDVTPPVEVEPEIPVSGDIAELIDQAQAHFEKAQEYVQAGDWAGFGREWDALQEVLEQLATLTGASGQ